MKQVARKRRYSKKRKHPTRKRRESFVENDGEISADSSGSNLPSQSSICVPENVDLYVATGNPVSTSLVVSVSGAVPVTTEVTSSRKVYHKLLNKSEEKLLNSPFLVSDEISTRRRAIKGGINKNKEDNIILLIMVINFCHLRF